MSATEDEKTILALAKLLRAELRDGCFAVTHLARSGVEFLPGADGGAIATTHEESARNEVDARALKAVHDSGAWKRESLRSDIQVEALSRGAETTARRAEFERVLDDIGVLFQGHVGHALGPLICGYRRSREQRDSPRKSTGVSESADLWNYLLVDACLGTPRRTATKVLRWAHGAPLAFETRVLLDRLTAASSFALSSGLSVERLPRNSNHLDYLLPTEFGVALSDYLDRTMLRIPCRIAPVLSKPAKVTDRRNGTPVVSWKTTASIETTWPLPNGGVRELTRALSLVCDAAVETPMIWIDYGEHAHFGQRYDSSNSGKGGPPARTGKASILAPDDLKEAIRLQPELCEPPDDVETALQYWLKSKRRGPDDADRLVFLRTALEALFLDRRNRGELAFRLATNGAWYIGRNRDERRRRYDVLKKVYAAASGAAHTGRVKRASAGLLKDGQEICRLAILKRLRSKQVPSGTTSYSDAEPEEPDPMEIFTAPSSCRSWRTARAFARSASSRS